MCRYSFAMAVRILREGSFVCRVGEEGCETYAETRESTLKSIPPCKRTSIPPSLTMSCQCIHIDSLWVALTPVSKDLLPSILSSLQLVRKS